MSSLSTTPHRYAQREELTPRSVLLATTIFLSGGFAGLFFATVFYVSQIQEELRSVQRDLDSQHQTIAQLTDTEDTATGTNSLLAQLNRQQKSLEQAQQSLVALEALEQDLIYQSTQVELARREVQQVASLIDELAVQAQRLDASWLTVEEMGRLQTEIAAQDGQTLYSLEAVDRQQNLNQRMLVLASEEDAMHGALTGFDVLAQRIQSVGERAEESSHTMDELDLVLARHREVGAELPGLEWDIETMAGVIERVAAQRSQINDARNTSRDMSALCDFVNAHDVAITNAVETLEQLDGLESEVDSVTREIETLVDSFHTVQGMNDAIQGVLVSGDRLRTGLAEMMLLEPAIERIVSDWNRIHADLDPLRSELTKQEYARRIIQENQQTITAEEMEESTDSSTRR